MKRRTSVPFNERKNEESNQKILKNYSYNLIFKLLDLFIPLITTPYLSRVLGDYGLGVFSYANSVATFFILLASAGINIYGQRECACIQKNRSKRTALLKEVTFLKGVLVAACGLIYWMSFAGHPAYGKLYQVLLITIIANAFDISWFFQGMEEFKKTAIRNMVFRLLGIAAILIFVKQSDDLLLYALFYSLPVMFGNLCLWFYLWEYLDHTKLNMIHSVKHIKPIAALFIPQIAIEIYTVLDKTMLGALAVSVEEVAYYEQAQKMVRVGLRFLTAFGTVMMSRVSNAYAEEGHEGVKKNLATSFQFTFFIGTPIMFGIGGIASSLVPWFFGAGFEKVAPLIILVAPIIMFIGVSNILGTQYLIPTRQQKIYTISVICGAVINFVLNLVLIPAFNSFGASLASVIAEGTVMMIQMTAVRKQIPLNGYLKNGWKYAVSAGMMLAVVCLVKCMVSVNMLCTMIQMIAGFASYIIFLFALRERYICSFFKKIWGRGDKSST